MLETLTEGLTTERLIGAMMAENQNTPPADARISKIIDLLEIAKSELRNIPKIAQEEIPEKRIAKPGIEESEQEARLAELSAQIAHECSDMFSYENRRGASIFTSKVFDAILSAAEEYGLIDLEQETYLSYRKSITISKLKRSYVYDRDGHQCVKCGAVENLTIDHIHPVIRGGTNDLHNLQVLCHQCNASKQHRVVK